MTLMALFARPAEDRRVSSPEEREQWTHRHRPTNREEREEIERRLSALERELRGHTIGART